MDPPRQEPGLGDVKAMFRTILERWSNPERTVAHGFRIVDVDGGLTFRTAAANARFIRRMQLGKPQKLSRATLETLAVIAYKQPVTKPQIEEVRGVDSSGALKALLDKKLIRVLGKAEEIGRPLLYGTTKTFLELFEMQSLTDLPTLKELHELEHGISPEPVVEGDDRPAVVMDLFNADQVSAVSEETERESNEAMEALEKALGEAKDVAKRASTLVLGVKVDDDEDKKEPTP
jgi:segregation and condensation protein B